MAKPTKNRYGIRTIDEQGVKQAHRLEGKVRNRGIKPIRKKGSRKK